MTVKVFFDTNILVYALDPSEPRKREISGALIREGFVNQAMVLSVQTLAECCRVLAIKHRIIPAADAFAFISSFQTRCSAPYDYETLKIAHGLQHETGYQWFDCVMLASARQARAHVFLSEDMTDGRDVGGVRIVNPYGAEIRTLDQLH